MSALFRGVTSKQVGDIYCLNCPRSYRAENTEKYISFSVPIKKQLDNSKIVTYKKGFSIALDLYQPYYQNLLILCLKFIAKNGEIKTANLRVSLNIVKIKNLLIGAVNVRKKG